MFLKVIQLGTAMICGVLLATVAQAGEPGKTLRVYFVGNSVTDTVRYDALAQLAKSRGYTHEWGRHMIPGCPLLGLWRASEKKIGFMERPYGYCREALANYTWDALSLQPFDRLLDNSDPKNKDSQGDVLYAQMFIDRALAKSPDVQIYIYSRWPRMTIKGKSVNFTRVPAKAGPGVITDLSGLDDWDKRRLAKYTGGWDGTNETRDYFETLTLILRKINPSMRLFTISCGYLRHLGVNSLGEQSPRPPGIYRLEGKGSTQE